MAFILFDLGGVLADVDQGRAERVWTDAGYPLASFHDAIYESGAKPLGDLGHIDAEGMRSRVAATLGREVSLAMIHEIWGAVVSWRPWVSGLLERLVLPYGVLSTIDPIHAAALGPLPGADPIIYSCEIGAVKPDPRAFQIAADRCPVSPERVRYVDDLPENVLAARAAGFSAYRVTGREELLRALSGLLKDELLETGLGDDLQG